jgi:AraC family transcriptional activator FtrA
MRQNSDMTSRRRAPAHQVACLVFDGVSPFEMGTVAEFFAVPRPELDVPWWYSFTLCTPEPGRIRAIGGFEVDVRAGLAALAHADTVVVPHVPDVDAPVTEPVAAALQAANDRGARLLSICTGAFALASAGVLDGLAATTHWRHVERLRERFPSVEVRPDVLYVDNGRVLTSAGTAAGIDLCLHVIRRDHGAPVAGRVANRMVVAAHREGGQAQFVDQPVDPAPADDPIADAVAYAKANLAGDLTVDVLARVAHLSTRQFERRFRHAVGVTPGRWIARRRIEAGRSLLTDADLPVESVAARVGLSVAGFRATFKQTVGLSPAAYRAQHAVRD